MTPGIQVFQPARNGLGQEVAQVEMPGELWPMIEELALRERTLFIDYSPQELEKTCLCRHTVNISEYLRRRDTTVGEDAALETLIPYVKPAMDMGYRYVILAA